MPVLNQISEALANSEQPLVKQIYDKAGKKLLAIGLRSGVALPEHIASGKAKLMVVQGEIDFNTETHSYRLERFDSFDIPEDVKHSVVGVFDAIFLLLLRDKRPVQIT
jgi:quercetin dioxygenase-like cupin family protein